MNDFVNKVLSLFKPKQEFHSPLAPRLPTQAPVPGKISTDFAIESRKVNPETDVEQLIRKYFPEDYETARAVFQHESQLGKYFQNLQGAPAYGVAQVYLPVWSKQIPGDTDEQKIEWLKDPDNNLSIARKIYDDRAKWDTTGWNAWDSYKHGHYKQYMRR